jgi:hypothetical protein
MNRRFDPFGLRRHIVAVMAFIGLLAGASLSAQSLGSVAKDAEAQRKTTKSSGKVYTNDHLKSDPRDVPTPTPAPAGAPAAPSPSAGKADDKAKQDAAGTGAKDEAYWRDRIKAEREGLARAETFAAALQSQINGLYAEFTACQAPPQCNEVAAKRQKSIAELDRAKKEIELHTKAITAIQEEARRAGVPAGWVR